MEIAAGRDDWRHSSADQDMLGPATRGPGRQARTALSAVGGISLLCGIAAGVAVAGSPAEARNVLTRGAIEAGVAAGFWQGTTVVGSAPSADRSAVLVLPRVGIVLTEPLGSGWWQGNVEVLVEPLFARFTRPVAAEAAGGSLVVKYNFLAFGRWLPFWDVGAGIIWTNLAPRIPEQSTPFEFVIETGPGVQYVLTDQLAWTLGVRFHHISNGNIGDRNTGINAVLPYVGVSFFVPNVF